MQFINLRYLIIGTASVAHADYGFPMGINPEMHLQPDSHINLPASIINTGTWEIVYGTSSGAFNGITFRSGEIYDFANLNIQSHAVAPRGAISYQYPMLGIGFPDGSNLLADEFTAPAQAAYRTRVIIDEETYARPLSLQRASQYDYFSGSTPATARIVLTSYVELAYADDTLGYHTHAANVAIHAIPEPETWMMFGLGLLGVLTMVRRISRQPNNTETTADPESATQTKPIKAESKNKSPSWMNLKSSLINSGKSRKSRAAHPYQQHNLTRGFLT